MWKKILFWFISSITSFFVATSFAFWATIDRFEVELSPKTAKVWESLDLTIKAVDKNGSVVTDYDWTIMIFSISDKEASLPIILSDATYKFKSSDQWVVKFENWVKFTKAWKQDIKVFDFQKEDYTWQDEVNITEDSSSSNSEIEFISPDNWITIWDNKIKVSWSTVKNHKVKIIVNQNKSFESTSNNNWIFEKEILNLKDWENIIKAQVLNSDLKVIWETSDLKVKVESNWLSIKNLKIIPEEVFVEWAYNIELLSNPWLKEVSVVVNDSVINLKESESWLYKWSSFAPKSPWTYKVDVNLLDDLWHKLNTLWVWSFKVKELNSALAEDKKELSTWELDSATEKVRDPLKITWLRLVELKTKSVLTWDKLEKAKSYNVYKRNSSWWLDLVTTVFEPKFEINIEWDKVKYEDFYVKANWEDENWEYEGVLSDPTKIKTWPELLIVLVLSLFFAWMYLFLKWRKEA